MIMLKASRIKKAAYLYMSLPVMCFLLFYMSSWAGIILFLVFAAVFFMVMRDTSIDGQDLRTTRKYLFVMALAVIMWTYFGGQGNLYYQSDDWHFRNAIYRDLLYRDWPVTYPASHKALVYYIGHWLPPAILTKGIGVIVPSICGTELMFRIGNMLLWLWTAVGVFIAECLLAVYARTRGKKILMVPVILVLFSGLDIIGVLRDIVKYGWTFEELHIEWWSQELQFSSLTTCLFWVFNQTVIPWIVILCLLDGEKINQFVFMGSCAFAAGPMPFVGIVVYMTVYAVYRGTLMFMQGKGRAFMQELFSLENLLALVIMPVFMIYYSSNSAVITGAEDPEAVSLSVFTLSHITFDDVKEIFFFLLVEAGVYLFILYRRYKQDIFFYITVGSVMLAPLVRVGNGTDFVMRFSIPAIMVMAAMTVRSLTDNDGFCEKKDRICSVLLRICIGIGAVTTLTEFARGYQAMLQNGRIVNVADDLKTMERDDIVDALERNIVAYDYEKNVFFRYLAPGK